MMLDSNNPYAIDSLPTEDDMVVIETDPVQPEITAKPARVKKEPAMHDCLCGCGAQISVKKRFKQGHDAKLHSMAKRAFLLGEKGITIPEQALDFLREWKHTDDLLRSALLEPADPVEPEGEELTEETHEQVLVGKIAIDEPIAAPVEVKPQRKARKARKQSPTLEAQLESERAD